MAPHLGNECFFRTCHQRVLRYIIGEEVGKNNFAATH
jgi:hypothetical protein